MQLISTSVVLSNSYMYVIVPIPVPCMRFDFDLVTTTMKAKLSWLGCLVCCLPDIPAPSNIAGRSAKHLCLDAGMHQKERGLSLTKETASECASEQRHLCITGPAKL